MHVLVVDDEPGVRNVLGEMIVELGHDVQKCGDVSSALELLETSAFDLVFSDVRMPGLDGLDFLERTKERPEAFVLMTGCADVNTAVQAMRLGAVDFVTKPFDVEAIGESMDRATRVLRERRSKSLMALESHSLAQILRGPVSPEAENTIASLVAALDARESETNHHSRRVSLYALEFAQILKKSPQECEAVRLGALLHDLGKIGVPDSILLKRGPLDEDEWVTMKRHPLIGAHIVRSLTLKATSHGIVLSHHERFDGKGYPFGLKGNDIPEGARIFAIIDALDAITSDRPYRKKRTFTEATEEFMRCAGSHFDPKLVEVFCNTPESVWIDIRNKMSPE